MRIDSKIAIAFCIAITALVLVILSDHNLIGQRSGPARKVNSGQALMKLSVNNVVTLTSAQMKGVKVALVQQVDFPHRVSAIGTIEFNANRTVQVLSAYQGKLRNVYVNVGDEIKKGAPLYDIDSPDLIQAESTLISAAGVGRTAKRVLQRASMLLKIEGISQKEVDQAVSDQQASEASYLAARNAVAIFGKGDSEIDDIVTKRLPNSKLTVFSPISGCVVGRNAQVGMLVLAGGGPAPVVVSDLSSVWLHAYVPEADVPRLKVGQLVSIKVMAFPDRTFSGEIRTLSASIDNTTHRMQVRAKVDDPKHELKPGMVTSLDIQTEEPSSSLGISEDGLVRERDGTVSAWITRNGRNFERRVVTIGATNGKFVQILRGLQPGESVVTEGAVFLSRASPLTAR